MSCPLRPGLAPVALALVLSTLGACASGGRQPAPLSPAEPGQPPAAAAAAPAPAVDRPPAEGPAGTQPAAKEARERQRKLARLERSLEVARLSLAKSRIAGEHAEAQHAEALAKADAELELARRRLENFRKITAPHRIARAELGLLRAEDGLRNAQEELEQLERMYSEEQFADQTKEIVIDRARRQLQRTQRDLELQRAEFRTLADVTLPLEQRELELALAQQERAAADLRRAYETAQIERRVTLLNGEAEVQRLTDELADLRAEIAEAEQKAAASQLATPPPAPAEAGG